ncbi:hypothetical protein [Streptomyces sp. NRRL F-5126]|uniref:hypothetical protein n=1 Tax=Streptomyces sp. NRRL F-5126 TaxID=1463857 RepID=UPI000ABE4D18|nr:hypothetical protein [Streptomyces sp. NRRL F-5126]
MTQCRRGGHEFPVEDDYGGYRKEHGVELIGKRSHDEVRPPHPLLPRPVDADEPASRAG